MEKKKKTVIEYVPVTTGTLWNKCTCSWLFISFDVFCQSQYILVSFAVYYWHLCIFL